MKISNRNFFVEEFNYTRLAILNIALALLGFPSTSHPKKSQSHEIGMRSDSGIDCSGFVIFVLKNAGLKIPKIFRHASELFDSYGVFVHRYSPGDLVFFSRDGLRPTHVGIMLTKDTYISSMGTRSGKVIIKKLQYSQIVATKDQIYLHNPI